MKLLKDRGYRARWYVLGEGDQRRALEKKIAALGLQEDFLLLGAVENPYPYYAQADLYIHATRFEGKSIAIQEAQTLGRAVVASDCNGNREQIEDGADGLLCALTPEAVADSIASLLEDEEKRIALGQAAGRRDFAQGQELETFLALLD
nr:glycosyltransferase [uncultured Acetatifactor sp.]